MESLVTIVVAVISACGAIGASVAGVYAAKSRKEQAEFRQENTTQHGATMALIKEIELNTRETKNDVREIRLDLDDLRDDFIDHVGPSPSSEPRPTKKAVKRAAQPKTNKTDTRKPARSAAR